MLRNNLDCTSGPWIVFLGCSQLEGSYLNVRVKKDSHLVHRGIVTEMFGSFPLSVLMTGRFFMIV